MAEKLEHFKKFFTRPAVLATVGLPEGEKKSKGTYRTTMAGSNYHLVLPEAIVGRLPALNWRQSWRIQKMAIF